jgi:hypothetical protein
VLYWKCRTCIRAAFGRVDTRTAKNAGRALERVKARGKEGAFHELSTHVGKSITYRRHADPLFFSGFGGALFRSGEEAMRHVRKFLSTAASSESGPTTATRAISLCLSGQANVAFVRVPTSTAGNEACPSSPSQPASILCPVRIGAATHRIKCGLKPALSRPRWRATLPR